MTGTDNVAIGTSLTPLLTNGSGTAQSLGVTIASGNEVSYIATVQTTTTLATGTVNYVVIRDDNHDNDCVTGGGDGTQIGGQVATFLGSITQSFTTTIAFSDTSPTAVSKKRPLILRPTTLLIMGLLGVGILFAVGYFRSSLTINQLQQAAAKSPDVEANELIGKLGKHMTLPNEKPIATVEDTKKLADQTFFKNAHEDDKVLMYTKAKKQSYIVCRKTRLSRSPI